MDAETETCVDVGYWTRLDDGRIECGVCPRFCKVRPGQRGLCFVRRAREDGAGMELTGYGRSTGFCVDPIEKKPLNHFLPGSAVLSFGTAGCNLACSFCQNWDISKSREVARLSAHAAPETIARAAERLGCASVAYTYNDPVIFMEYALDAAAACRARGVKNVAVTAGFICAEPRKRLFAGMDAANVDLKGFTERFYAKRCAGSLEPVLDTLKYLVHETNVWTEITTLLIPGENDFDEELDALTQWVARELRAGRSPAFHRLPSRLSHAGDAAHAAARRCKRRAPSPSATGFTTSMSATSTIRRGRRRSARPAARARLRATATRSRAYALDASGACSSCGTRMAGVFAAKPGAWGSRRLSGRHRTLRGVKVRRREPARLAPKPLHHRADRLDIGLRVAGGLRRDHRILDIALGFARQRPVHRRVVGDRSAAIQLHLSRAEHQRGV